MNLDLPELIKYFIQWPYKLLVIFTTTTTCDVYEGFMSNQHKTVHLIRDLIVESRG